MTKNRSAALRFASLIAAIALAAVTLLALSAGQSQAQESMTCPAGTTLSADGTACLSDAVDDNTTTTTSCLQGVLSDDGQFCIVPRIDQAPAAAGATAPVTDAPIPAFTG